MSQSTTPRQRQLFVLFLLAVLPAGNALNPCLDVDTWWHLRVGQFIVTEQKLPDADPFSQLGREQHVPWTAYSWLYELALYQAWVWGGFSGIMVFRHLLDLMTFGGLAWFFLRHAHSNWIGLAVLALVTVAFLPFTPERPWHFTIFFTVLTLHAVLRIREGARAIRFAWLPLIYVLWANIHIQFVMGFALLGLAFLVSLVEWRRRDDPVQRIATRSIFFLGAACFFATFVTPFHYRLYIVIWEYATQTVALRLVSELQPPVLWKWWNIPLVVLLLAAALSVAKNGYRLWDLVLLASALFFSMRMQRDLWYGVLAAGTIVVRNTRISVANEKPIARWHLALAVVLALLVIRIIWEVGLSQGKNFATCHAESYPVAAADYVKSNRLEGPIYNDFDWGGYLIWALPDYPVSIDGRTNLYGEERLIRSMNTWQASEGWETDPALIRARVVIAPKKRENAPTPLTEKLRQHPSWKKRFEDDVSVVFVRVAP